MGAGGEEGKEERGRPRSLGAGTDHLGFRCKSGAELFDSCSAQRGRPEAWVLHRAALRSWPQSNHSHCFNGGRSCLAQEVSRELRGEACALSQLSLTASWRDGDLGSDS